MLGVRKRGMTGLTLLELLTTVCIIGLIASILVPNFWRASGSANYTGCAENLRNLATALYTYQTENSERYPSHLMDTVPGYIHRIPTCPLAQTDTYSASYVTSADQKLFTVYCQGNRHDSDIPDIPWYTSERGLGPNL